MSDTQEFLNFLFLAGCCFLILYFVVYVGFLQERIENYKKRKNPYKYERDQKDKAEREAIARKERYQRYAWRNQPVTKGDIHDLRRFLSWRLPFRRW